MHIFDRPLNALRNLKSHYYKARIYGAKSPFRVWGRRQDYQTLFMLSHMRSGSSLLTHILNTNPTIIGYGETHIQYQSVADFKELMLRVYTINRPLRMNHAYMLDKLLHNHKLLNNQLLLENNLRIVFLVREPLRTIQSILEIKPHWPLEKAVGYYLTRLEKLEDYAKLIDDRQRTLFFTHHQLLEDTASVFKALQSFLGAESPFSEEYSVLGTTGKKGIGDSSPNIKAGRIVRQNRSLTPADLHLDSETSQKLFQTFERCCQVLSQHCTAVEDADVNKEKSLLSLG